MSNNKQLDLSAKLAWRDCLDCIHFSKDSLCHLCDDDPGHEKFILNDSLFSLGPDDDVIQALKAEVSLLRQDKEKLLTFVKFVRAYGKGSPCLMCATHAFEANEILIRMKE